MVIAPWGRCITPGLPCHSAPLLMRAICFDSNSLRSILPASELDCGSSVWSTWFASSLADNAAAFPLANYLIGVFKYQHSLRTENLNLRGRDSATTFYDRVFVVMFGKHIQRMKIPVDIMHQ
jgi:hypothetical protein